MCDSSTPISTDDSRLNTPQTAAWQPPAPWDESRHIDADRRAWIESLAAHDLRSKADGGFTCREFYRKTMGFSNHFAALGRTTCHCKSCRNCGTGKMRAHRIYSADPE